MMRRGESMMQASYTIILETNNNMVAQAQQGAIYAPLVPVVMVDESDMGLPHMVGGPLGSDDDSDVDDLPELVDE